jgi:arabinan endo-1,5-alpha-L-arabinosidase
MKKVLSFVLSLCFVISCFAPFEALAGDQYDSSNIQHTVIHDPSLMKAENGKYYIVGSHLVMSESDDLINWNDLGYSIDGTNYFGDDWKTALAEPLKWTTAYQLAVPSKYDPENLEYNCWANDVIYNEAMGKYCLYGACSVWGATSSVIWLATSDNIEGPYTYQDSLVYTGITNYKMHTLDVKTENDDPVVKALDYHNTNLDTLVKNGTITKSLDSVAECKWFTRDGYYKCGWGEYPNAIDPTTYYDADGNLWMVYGSYSGGCYVIPLVEETGLPDYAYMRDNKGYDVYFGKQISVTNAETEGTGEGPFIIYDNVSGYYYFFLTYGGLAGDGGYNIREYRSKSPDGPFEDASGNYATDAKNTGLKLDGNYQFSNQASGYLSGGHSSCLIDDDGTMYQAYHTRYTVDSGWGFKTVIHQMLRTSDGWAVLLPYQYQGEKVSQNGYSASDIVGTYELVDSTNITQRLEAGADLSSIVLPTQGVTLNADGTISGAKDYSSTITNANTGSKSVSGSWKLVNGSYQAVIKLGDVTYNAVFCKQYEETADADEVMTFGAAGSDNSTLFAVRHTVHTYVKYSSKATTSKDGEIATKCKLCGDVKSSNTIAYPKSVTLSATSYTYDGKEKKPTVTVKDRKGNKIASSNYTVTYSNNKNPGTATVKITFKGNYSGSISKKFTIAVKGTSISSLTAKSKGFVVKWKKQTTGTTGYQIQYSTSNKFNSAKTVIVSKNSTVSKTVTKLKAKKKYYVRIRTYKTISGKKYYSSWSSAKSVTTKK